MLSKLCQTSRAFRVLSFCAAGALKAGHGMLWCRGIVSCKVTSLAKYSLTGENVQDLTRMGAGMEGGGASAMGLTSAKRLSAVTGTGEAKLGLGRPKGLKATPEAPFAPLPAAQERSAGGSGKALRQCAGTSGISLFDIRSFHDMRALPLMCQCEDWQTCQCASAAWQQSMREAS